ncbi:MAG: hypothetical protein H0T65_16380, partial [Deltaproteobacteria bacterium]|nr:hypothetical protein [Deltaproteobacteria bacterium]
MSTQCDPVLDELDELVAGNPDAIARHSEHLASCDDCRDARHDATQLADAVRGAGGDYLLPADLVDRVLAQVDAQQLATGSMPGATSPGMAVAKHVEAPAPAPAN